MGGGWSLNPSTYPVLLTSGPVTISSSSFLRNHTQKFGTTLDLCAAQRPWLMQPTGRKGGSHQRPVFSEYPYGRQDACPCPTPLLSPSTTDSSDNGTIGLLQVLSVGRQLLFNVLSLSVLVTYPTQLLGLLGSLLPYRGLSIFCW